MPDPAPAPSPAASPPPAPANGKPPENGHQAAAPAANPTPPPFDPAAAGLVYRNGQDGKPGKWVRPYKADGKEYDFDPTDPEAWHGVSTHKAAQKHISKAAEAQKAWDDIIRAFERDPVSTIRQMAEFRRMDADAVQKQIAAEMVRREKLSPEAKELERFKAEKAARDSEDAEAQETQHQQAVQAHAKRWDQGIRKAMAAEGLAEEPEVLEMMAGRALVARRAANGGPVNLTQIAKDLRARLPALGLMHLAKYDDDKLLPAVPEDLRKRIRALEAKLAEAEATAKTRPAAPPPVNGEARSAAKPDAEPRKKKHMSEAEKRAVRARLAGGKVLL